MKDTGKIKINVRDFSMQSAADTKKNKAADVDIGSCSLDLQELESSSTKREENDSGASYEHSATIELTTAEVEENSFDSFFQFFGANKDKQVAGAVEEEDKGRSKSVSGRRFSINTFTKQVRDLKSSNKRASKSPSSLARVEEVPDSEKVSSSYGDQHVVRGNLFSPSHKNSNNNSPKLSQSYSESAAGGSSRVSVTAAKKRKSLSSRMLLEREAPSIQIRVSWSVSLTSRNKQSDRDEEKKEEEEEEASITRPVHVTFAAFMKANKMEESKIVLHSFCGSYMSLVYEEDSTFAEVVKKVRERSTIYLYFHVKTMYAYISCITTNLSSLFLVACRSHRTQRW
jgi:hypothetical protein